MELYGGGENKGAQFSLCGKYRYALWRIWDETKPLVMFIGLNPSTANEATNDQTIDSVKRISVYNGYGGFYMMNCFGIISKDPQILKQIEDPQGENLEWHGKIRERCQDVVFAWGNFKEVREIAKEMIIAYPNALCIRKNNNGSPVHPLYQKEKSKLIKFKD